MLALFSHKVPRRVNHVFTENRFFGKKSARRRKTSVFLSRTHKAAGQPPGGIWYGQLNHTACQLSKRTRQGRSSAKVARIWGARSLELLQITRERSKKTEAVFLVGSRGSGGKSKSPRARFLLPAFSFGEAKENAGQQSQISRHTESCSKSPPSFSSKMPPPLSGEAHTRTHRPRRLPLQGGRAGVLYKMGILPNLHKSLTFFRLYFSCFSGTIFFTEEWSIWI